MASPVWPEFIADYARAENMLRGCHSGDTFNGLVREFTNSIEFETKLSATTQREYRRMLTKAEPEFGDMPREALNDPAARKELLDWRATIARTSGEREADNRLSVISAMFTWAVDNGRLNAKTTSRVPPPTRRPLRNNFGFPERIHRFMGAAPVELQRALIIALHTGQRQGDILRLPWSAYDGTAISLRQGKSARAGRPAPLVTIPCTKALRRMLDSMERVSPLILTTKTGRSFKKRYFAHLWEIASQVAGLKHLHFHDLRGTAVTMLSEAGCNPQQVATITGHSLKTVTAILDRYLARTRGLAEQAIFNWENSPRTEFANRLQTGAPAPTAQKGKANDRQ